MKKITFSYFEFQAFSLKNAGNKDKSVIDVGPVIVRGASPEFQPENVF